MSEVEPVTVEEALDKYANFVPNPGRRNFLKSYFPWAIIVAAGIASGPSVLSYIERLKFTFEDGFPSPKQINVQNDAAMFRAATVKLYSNSGYGHGSIIERGDKLSIYTIQHVVESLTERRVPKMVIPDVGAFPIYPNRFSPAAKPIGTETDIGYFYDIRPDQQDPIRKAVASKIIEPLRLANTNMKLDEIVVIPRGDKYVYVVFRTGAYLGKSNRFGLTAPNINSTPVCEGDSRSPVLKYPLTGEIYGLLTSAYVTKLDAKADRMCSGVVFIRPNG